MQTTKTNPESSLEDREVQNQMQNGRKSYRD